MATYTDIDLSFKKHPGTKDILRLYDIEAVKAALRNILLYSKYEKPFDPNFGVTIKGLLFENHSAATNAIILRQLNDQIVQYEPRVVIDDLKIKNKPDEHEMVVELYFHVIGNPTTYTLNIAIERVR